MSWPRRRSGPVPKRGRGAFLLRVAVSVGLLALLVAWVDRERLARLLLSADPAFLGLVVVLVTADRLLMAWKWWLLVRGRAAAVGLWAAVRAYYLASFAGLFLPMTVGADAVRVAALAGEGRTAGLVASVILERGVGALAQTVLGSVALGTLLALGLGGGISPTERAVLAAVVLAAFVAFPFSFPAARWVAARFAGAGGVRGGLASMAAAYAGYGASAGLVGLFFALTLLEGGFPIAYHWAAGRALGLDPGWTLYLATVPIVFFVARLPVSLGGLGVLELSFVYLAGILGLTATDAFSIAVLAEACVLVSLLPGGLVYWFPATPAVSARPRERLP